MRYIDFSAPVKVHFTGIGGISMSGFAQLLKSKGFTVTGSDRAPSAITEQLESLGITVFYGQRASNIGEDTAVLVYTAAVKQDNPELVRARELGIPTIDRAEMVGDVMLQYTRNYAVAGTHGKTTTTSMLSLVMLKAGLDPTVSVGGVLDSIGGNMHIGSSSNMVIEACEYTDSFLKFHPTHAIITNIEPEHLDYFGDISRERDSFRRFAGLLPADGLLVANTCIPDGSSLFGSASCRVVYYNIYGGDGADYYASDISYGSLGCASFTLMRKGEALGHISLGVVGEHNVGNAVAVCAMALESGISFDDIAAGLAEYIGTHRRFEKKGEIAGITIIDDYAHHPTEMAATLKAAKGYPHKRLVVVFQPHTYSRTAAFLPEMAEALSAADLVVLADIYAAREVNTFGVSSGDIADILRDKYGKEVYYFPSFDEIEDFLLQNCYAGDLLITMGAGDVVLVGESLLGK